MSSPILHCASCQSTDLSPLTSFGVSGEHVRLIFKQTAQSNSIFSNQEKKYLDIRRGRVCKTCGHVMLFLDQADLEATRAHWNTLSEDLQSE